MGPLELAQKYMACFYGILPLKEMRGLLADDLEFRGPLFEFNSAEAYIDSLTSDPPKDVVFEIISSYEKGNSACLIYKFTKPGVETIMAQVFEAYAGKITKIQLIFDTRAFK